jgi:hypothetical protein
MPVTPPDARFAGTKKIRRLTAWINDPMTMRV